MIVLPVLLFRSRFPCNTKVDIVFDAISGPRKEFTQKLSTMVEVMFMLFNVIVCNVIRCKAFIALNSSVVSETSFFFLAGRGLGVKYWYSSC